LLQERRWFGGTEHAILIYLCLNEHYYFYFSPGAAEIAGSLVEAHGAETCSPPVRGGYLPVVVVGIPNARETNYEPETECNRSAARIMSAEMVSSSWLNERAIRSLRSGLVVIPAIGLRENTFNLD